MKNEIAAILRNNSSRVDNFPPARQAVVVSLTDLRELVYVSLDLLEICRERCSPHDVPDGAKNHTLLCKACEILGDTPERRAAR